MSSSPPIQSQYSTGHPIISRPDTRFREDTPPRETLQTLSEEDAPEALRATFVDLRQVLKVPVAPLVWRHLAAIPGCLVWSWSALRPYYLSRAVERAAARLTSSSEFPPLPPLHPATLGAVGIDDRAHRVIIAILEIFNQSNPMNLIALSVLLSGIHGLPGGGRYENTPSKMETAPRIDTLEGSQSSEDTRNELDIPPMLSLEDMNVEATALAWSLTRMGGPNAPEALPSVWRILARWPGYLALAHAQLGTLESSGWLPGAREKLQDGLGEIVRDLLTDQPFSAPAPPAGVLDALKEALPRFTGSALPRIIPKMAALRHTFPPAVDG